ncbi:MAG: hypothetical protein II793_05035 [Bacteroidales bacterium]|nr:hypothetical protein [Bacteroidales bacterium]
MKKLIFPLIALLFLATSCIEDEPDIIQNVYQGSYVYVEYPEVAASDWTNEIEIISATTHRTSCLYYEYRNQYIDDNMIQNSFVLVYSLQGERDVALPVTFTYTDGTGAEHTGLIQYNVAEGVVRIVIVSLDGTYDALTQWLDAQGKMVFKVCMMIND